MKHTRVSLLTLTFALFGAALGQAVPSVNVTATASGFQVPATVPVGHVQFNFGNAGAPAGDIVVFKVNSGADPAGVKKTLSALAVGLATGEDTTAVEQQLFNLGQLYGGALSIAPQGRVQVGMGLEPGTYVVSTTATNDDQKNPKALADMGFFQTFTVPAGKGAAAPKTDYTVQLADFAVSLPPTQVMAGTHTWEVVNDGRQPHFMTVAKLKSGVTADDVMKMMASDGPPSGPAPMEDSPGLGMNVLSPGRSATVTMTLTPGTYFTACFVADPVTHKPHAMLGMIRFFTVK
ncbi:hypothetical protein GCM10010840_27110 [Deinococcus aerolatus]|uniref:Blue (type 1) copper domain-containing protein n=1 Tax=Deinococcus aerolatus TaxID=522487 RepID=A0ABQ2GDN7_9DEIO|nr:hypothetical protein [Deinococcus aerolatus]GGL87704.1 hypothetical protein GCM10010840_27110 [Deinococcus aerolatus]